MSDPWQDEGYGSEDDWDEGKESLEVDLEDGFDEPDEGHVDDEARAEDDEQP